MGDIDYGQIAVAALQDAVDRDDPTAVYTDASALLGIARPGIWAGEIEARLTRLPLRHQHAIRRAAKAVSRTEPRGDNREPAAQPGTLPVLGRQHPGTWWLRDRGTYVAVDGEILAEELRRAHPLVPTTVTTAAGEERPARASELYRLAEGVRVDRLVYEMGLGEPRWDSRAHTLYVPCCQLVPGLVEESVRVGGWLRALAGERLPRLLDWVALCARLQHPIAALYVEGPASAGKGLLAGGLCGLWGGERSTYDEVVLRGWTGGLRQTPVVHLDERAGRDREERGSGAFRSLVGESTHELREKHRPAATIQGCARLIVTAQGPDALRISEEDLSALDEEAIGLRLLHVQAQPEARRVLEALGGRATTEGWCDPRRGELVAHLRWVIATRQVQPDSRLLVEGDPATWLRGAAQRRGLPQAILVAVARALLGARQVGCPADASDGVAYVSCDLLHQRWRELTGDDRGPSLQALGRGLSRLGGRVHRYGAWVYAVEGGSVVEAAELVGLDAELLRTRLG